MNLLLLTIIKKFLPIGNTILSTFPYKLFLNPVFYSFLKKIKKIRKNSLKSVCKKIYMKNIFAQFWDTSQVMILIFPWITT